MSSYLKRLGLEVGLPTSYDLINKKNPSQVYPATWVLVIPDTWSDNQEELSQIYPMSDWHTALSPYVMPNFQMENNYQVIIISNMI